MGVCFLPFHNWWDPLVVIGPTSCEEGETYIRNNVYFCELCTSMGDNSLKVQYFLSFSRHYHIYFVFISTFTRKYESLQVFSKIYSLRVFLFYFIYLFILGDLN